MTRAINKAASNAGHCFPGLLAKLALTLVLSALVSGCGMFSQPTVEVPPEFSANKVAKTAYSQMGKKYRSGGASPQKGFDCSGLVWWSYGQHGVKIPRITTDQAKTGKSVSRKQARAGDIVVFRTGNSPRGLHTGVYAGRNKFIHSPGSGKKVCMESMLLPHWKETLISIRRVGE